MWINPLVLLLKKRQSMVYLGHFVVIDTLGCGTQISLSKNLWLGMLFGNSESLWVCIEVRRWLMRPSRISKADMLSSLLEALVVRCLGQIEVQFCVLVWSLSAQNLVSIINALIVAFFSGRFETLASLRLRFHGDAVVEVTFITCHIPEVLWYLFTWMPSLRRTGYWNIFLTVIDSLVQTFIFIEWSLGDRSNDLQVGVWGLFVSILGKHFKIHVSLLFCVHLEK